MKRPNRIAKKFFAALVLGACTFNAQANLYEDGLMAYAVGNFIEAGSLLMSAAEQGDAGAEHMLMRMFSEGKLYAANLEKETLKWTKKAAEQELRRVLDFLDLDAACYDFDTAARLPLRGYTGIFSRSTPWTANI